MVDRRTEASRKNEITRIESQRVCKQPHLGFQEAVELSRVTDCRPRDTAFHPATQLARQAIAEHRLHAELTHMVERLPQQVEAPEPLELQLAEADVVHASSTFDVGQLANWLVKHDRNFR